MSEIKDIIIKNKFVYNKQFGQNFITDTNLLMSIVNDSNIDEDTTVLEIGAGAGSLTREIAKVAKKVIAFEIDKKLIPILDESLRDFDNITLISQDIMKYDDTQLKKLLPEKFKIVANLPYYITTPLIMRFIESEVLDVDSITIMVQKEVGERIVAKESTPDYSALSVGIQIVADVEYLRTVSKKMFYPVPNVDSAIIKINVDKNKYKIDNFKQLKAIIKSAFAMRRKTLINNLSKSDILDKTECCEVLTKMNLDTRIRGEALSINQFVELSNLIKKS